MITECKFGVFFSLLTQLFLFGCVKLICNIIVYSLTYQTAIKEKEIKIDLEN